MKLVVAEVKDGKLTKSTLEMVTAARECGVDGPVAVLVLGADASAEAAGVADRVLTVQATEYDAEVWAAAVAQVAKEQGAKVVL
ncbi:MAG TPA: hypothetical protein VG267_09090, partial [Terracidiphilus sp.]|nr:hypothetical protein [Terracidiphilus sp.]